jgi:serine/threonine-protein kinase RsbT
MDPQSCVKIKKELDIVGARQLGRELAKEIGFSTVDQARIATAISELARNIYLYANHGKLTFEVIEKNVNRTGLCLVAEDEGPGISDLSRVLEDGFTTSGGLGAGLPGVKRLMDEFEIHSEVGKGTKITAIKWLR